MIDAPDQAGTPEGQRPPNSVITRLVAHIPQAQFGRYLLVGLWNTVFGYGTYAGLTALFTPRMPHAYIIASLLANLISITFAFLAYKWFVFKTKGGYFREWLRCVAVYGGASLLGTALLPVVVFALRNLARLHASAPYVAGVLVMGPNIVLSFLGHKHFSFATARKMPVE